MTPRNDAHARGSPTRRVVRLLGTLLLAAGVASLAWAFAVWRWEDPVTSLYGEYRQRQLASEYEQRIRALPPPAPPRRSGSAASLDEVLAAIAVQATSYRHSLGQGEPVGRIRIPKLGLDAIVTNGSDAASLRNGPGRDGRTFMPGEGELVYVAWHRTTYTAPFSRIDRLRRGDVVVLEVPYATFEYGISRHEVVRKDAVDRLQSRGREELRLQASHPRFLSSHRYLAYALLQRVRPRGADRFLAVAATGQTGGREALRGGRSTRD